MEPFFARNCGFVLTGKLIAQVKCNSFEIYCFAKANYARAKKISQFRNANYASAKNYRSVAPQIPQVQKI